MFLRSVAKQIVELTCMDNATIRYLETLAAQAWPAARVEPLDGWLLRSNAGVTRRANSVWPNDTGEQVTLGEKLVAVEAFYAGQGLPARYQICPAAQPDDLDAILTARGYRIDAPTLVQTAPLDSVLASLRPLADLNTTLADRVSDCWFDTYVTADGFNEREANQRRGILQRIAGHTVCAAAESARQTVAVGLGVRDGDWLGVFCMATCREHRRRGAARTVLHALMRWGEQQGASNVYLQVMADNQPALALYQQAGFQTLYGYHYRERLLPG
jgi:N-acetylglutamate synthase